MNIPYSLYEAYTDAIALQVGQATTRLGAFIDSFNWNVDFAAKKAMRNMVIEEAYALYELYGLAAATVAADFYDDLALLAGEHLDEAIFPEMASMDSMAASMRNAAKSLYGEYPSVEQFRINTEAALTRYIKNLTNDTIIKNALRDNKKSKGIRWARVPMGPEPCVFCMMLASRGFDYITKESAELYGHSHEHCMCDVICSFGFGTIEGYDFKQYQDFYYDNVEYDQWGHVDTRATEQNMRRAHYEMNKDHINQKRREWYARNAEKEKARLSKYKTKEYKEKKAAEKEAKEEVYRKLKEKMDKELGPKLEAHEKKLSEGDFTEWI